MTSPTQEPAAPVDPDVHRQLDLLSQMVEEISGELALAPLLASMVERACRLIGADDGVIGLYVPERDVIRTAARESETVCAALERSLQSGPAFEGVR